MSAQPKPLRLADSIDPKLGIESIDAENLSDAAAELRRLNQFEQAYIEWQDKTEWVQKSAHFSELGMHRADVLTRRIARLEQQNKELLDALKGAKESIESWGAYATPYFQDKHDLAGDIEKLESSISKAEGTPT